MMLKSITLKNLATISDTSLEFQPGLNVLTGETGSGKSILVDGLMLATGKRADLSLVRPGTRNAFIEAAFLDSSGEETVIRREINLQGRSRIFIDDSLATLDEVKNSVQHFVELHSQRSTPVLLRPARQLELLDRYAGTGDLRESYSKSFALLKENLAGIEELEKFLGVAETGREVLLHEMAMFSELQPSEEDYNSLVYRERELRNAAEHSVLFAETAEILHGDDGVSSSLSSILKRMRKESPDSTALIELLEQAMISVSEASSLLSDEIEAGEEAPERMAEIEDRLDLYSRLISRFGGTLEAVLSAGITLEKRLNEYEEAVIKIGELRESAAFLSQEILQMSRELTAERTASGNELAGRTLEEMKRLNMPWAQFRVELDDLADGIEIENRKLGPSGGDRIAFMFTANKGIPMDTLESIASGGELSRVALSLALALADSGSASTLIFDEIDSGTGGETAHLLADSLLRASGSRQIIVISHLAQIASRALRHLAVEKNYKNGMPLTTVKHLESSEERALELARLLGGGEGAFAHANRLLEERD